MITLILIVHVIIAVLLISVVLLQIGKGASLSNLFGGGTGREALFTSAGGDVFLKRLTTVLAIIFFLTSLSLTVISSRMPTRSILDEAGPVKPLVEKEIEAKEEGEAQKSPVDTLGESDEAGSK